jgi:hypothetical protein
MESIKVGDRVHVNINNAQMTLTKDAEVLHMPQATGDSWIFKAYDTNELYYVSEGCTIAKKL